MRNQIQSSGLIMLMALHLGGCSLFMAAPPPESHWRHPSVPFKDCNQDYSLPVVDTVISGTGLGAMVTSIVGGGGTDSGSGLLFVAGAALFIPWGLAAWRGYLVRDRCERYVNQIGPFNQKSTP